MEPRSFECSRCGMAVPVEVDRCPSCRSRRSRGPVVPHGASRTGPAAAEAWDAWERQLRTNTIQETDLLGDPHAACPVAPVAAWAATALRAVVLAAIATAAVQATRLVLAVTIEDPVELVASPAWDSATTLADIAVAMTAAATMAAVVLVVGWVAVAGQNVRALALDTSRWGPSIRRVALLTGTVVALAAVWGWLPGQPEQTDRVAELAAAFATAVALVVAASGAERLLLAVTTLELEQTDLLLRIEAASVERPRSRSLPA